MRALTLGLAAAPWLFGVPLAYVTVRLARRRLIDRLAVAVVAAQVVLGLVWSVALVLDAGPVWRWLPPAGVVAVGAGLAFARRRLVVAALRSPPAGH